MSGGFDLSDYVLTSERIGKLYASYPDARIVATPPEIITIDDRVFLSVTASVYRTPDDPTPCVGTAWEPFPGRTPYTKDSEAMNAETSAVGRALALAGIEVRRSIASRDEVRTHQVPDADRPHASAADKARAKVTFDRLKMSAGTDTATAVRDLANEHDRKLTLTALVDDPTWRAQVDALLDQHTHHTEHSEET